MDPIDHNRKPLAPGRSTGIMTRSQPSPGLHPDGVQVSVPVQREDGPTNLNALQHLRFRRIDGLSGLGMSLQLLSSAGRNADVCPVWPTSTRRYPAVALPFSIY